MSMQNLRRTVLGAHGPKQNRTPVNFQPIKWSTYFDDHDGFTSPAGYFHYYIKGTTGPVLVCIHGGGYSGLSWALFAQDITSKVDCRVMAVDLRGHGNTKSESDDDLSLDQLSKDITELILNVFEGEEISVILLGHSLGGAVAVASAPNVPNLAGVIIIDIVEGTALDSLSVMQGILRGRPRGFKTIEQAVQWGFRGGSTQNIEAARVSMPGQIKNITTNVLASEEVELGIVEAAPICETESNQSATLETAIIEEDEGDDEGKLTMKPPLPNAISSHSSLSSTGNAENKYTWRIDLTKTEQYWPGWFKGLSQKFLNINAPKILLMANISGLDTCLTVGQMQGKFQLQVLARSGHAVHEDQPDHVADIVATFLVRQRLATAIDGFTPIVPGC